jgi:hypothetical protein
LSNRTLIEINHDFAHMVKENPERFAEELYRYLGSASAENASNLTKYGIRRFGIRHHSEAFDIKFGCFKAAETAS